MTGSPRVGQNRYADFISFTARGESNAIFLKDEKNEDLVIVQARYGDVEDNSESEEILPVSPP